MRNRKLTTGQCVKVTLDFGEGEWRQYETFKVLPPDALVCIQAMHPDDAEFCHIRILERRKR